MIALLFWWALGLTITTFSVAWIVRRSRELGLAILVSFFSIYVVSANILVPRLVAVDLSFTTATVVSGSLLWPFTGQLIDMINEIYGRRRAVAAIGIAFACNALFVTFVWLAKSSGATPQWSPEQEEFWLSYFVKAPRILAASMGAAFVAMAADAYLFDALRRRWWRVERQSSLKGIAALAGLRAVTSDVVNIAIDGPLFALLAFAFVLPTSTILDIAVGSLALKFVLMLLEKPWFVAFRLLVRNVPRSTAS